MEQEIKFGTDGWRGIIGDTYTFKNVRIVSQAVADYLGTGKRVAVGFDTRFLSGSFARTCAEVLSHNGIDVLLSERFVSTPILSFAVKSKRLDLGVMITASHNPCEYNGFKIKDPTGGSASPEITDAIESLLGKSPVKEVHPAATRIRTEDLSAGYIRFIRSYIDLKKIKTRKFKVLVDAMYGAGNSFIADILKGTGIRVDFIHDEINPSFAGIRPEPVEEHLEELKSRVKKGKYDLGIALDGDADRIAAVASQGVFVHPQKILGMLTLHLHQDRGWRGGIVKTIAGTTMIDHIARFLKVKLYETPVGFKYISNLMEKEEILAGGEEAGGIGVKGYIPERDGTVAGLLLLEMMAYRRKNIQKILEEIEKKFGRYYYLRDEVKLEASIRIKSEKLPSRLLKNEVVEVKDYDGVKMICADESWLMLRASGTEPIVRIYAESKKPRQSQKLIELGKQLVRRHL
ncbi:MAG: phosphoglucomutase/phosphomannomutase family protein [Candidatus Omnitrophota bacterium]